MLILLTLSPPQLVLLLPILPLTAILSGESVSASSPWVLLHCSEENLWGLVEQVILRTSYAYCRQTITVIALKGSQNTLNTIPNHFPGLMLSLSSTRLLMKGRAPFTLAVLSQIYWRKFVYSFVRMHSDLPLISYFFLDTM